MEIHECDVSTDQLEAMLINISETSQLRLQTLVFQVIEYTDISGVSPSALAVAVCKLKRCDLFSSGMTTLQIEELCREIVNCKNLTLKQLNIGNNSDLEDVSEDILAPAMIRLEVVDLGGCNSDSQLNAIFNKVAECSDSQLGELYIEYIDEENVDPSILKKVREKTKIYIDEMLSFP